MGLQKRVYGMLMANVHKFEQPAWFTQLVLAIVAWFSKPSEIFIAFVLSLLFTWNETPPLSLMIAFLCGTLLARGRFLIVLIPLFKLVIYDRLIEEHYQETSVMNTWNTKELWITLTGFAYAYRGPLEFWFQMLVILFYATVIVGRIVITDIGAEMESTLPAAWR